MIERSFEAYMVTPVLVITMALKSPEYPNYVAGSDCTGVLMLLLSYSDLSHDPDLNTVAAAVGDTFDLCDCEGHSLVSECASADVYSVTGGLASMSPINRCDTEDSPVCAEFKSVCVGSESNR